jgi:streptogramin lyase
VPMRRISHQSSVSIVAALLFAAGCSAEQQTQAEPEATDVASAPAASTPTPVYDEESYSGVIEGVVRDASGNPVAGAYVKLRNDARRLLFMHISQDGGNYTAIKLPPGNYSVQAVGGDFESDWSAPVKITDAGNGVMDVSLDVERAPDLPPGWTRRSPEYASMSDSIPDGPEKNLIMARCTICHTEARIFSRHVGAEAWADVVDDMRLRMGVYGIADLSDEDAQTIITYLSENYPPLPPPDPNSRFPRELQAADARNYRVVEYILESPLVENHDIAVDPWGRGWSNQRVGGKIGHFDPVTYEFGEIQLPPNQVGRVRPGNPQITDEGIMWISEPFGNRWLSYDIAKEEWTEYPFPSDQIRGLAYANTMTFHPDGTVWGSGPGNARRLNPVTREWDAWETPSFEATGMDPGVYGISVAGDGRVWMPLENVDRFARIDPDSGEVVEFEIPVEGNDYPRRMDSDPDGNIWFALWSSGKIVEVDYQTDEMTVIDPPMPYNGAYAIDFNEETGLMWTTLHTRDIIASYEPDTGVWHTYPLPQAESDSRRVEIDQNYPNRIWWSTVAYQARIGFIELLDE